VQPSAFAMPDSADGLIIVAFMAVGVLVSRTAAKSAIRAMRRRNAEFDAAWARQGWRRVPVGDGPRVMNEGGFRDERLRLVKQIGDHIVWMNWRNWINGSGENSSGEHRTTYFVQMTPAGYPELLVRRRTRLGGQLIPRRGLGTGDPDFDQAFTITPHNTPGPNRILTSPIRQALLVGTIPAWQIRDNTLIIEHRAPPRSAADIDTWAQEIILLAAMLPLPPARDRQGTTI